MSLEFELPLFSFLFILLLNGVYFFKSRAKIIENQHYSIILICSLIEALINVIIHFICSVNDFATIVSTYYILFDYLNKILVMLFSITFSSLLMYILIISYEKVRKKPKTAEISLLLLNVLLFIVTLFTHIELIQVRDVTNVKGWTTTIGYSVVAILLVITTFVAIKNIHKNDKRYLPVFLIILMLGFLYGIALFFPGIIIYDVSLAFLCYVMYFTIENPDMKLIEQLNIARDQAEKANNAKTEFLSNMSHEIRTPLNAIVGFSQALLEEELSDEAKDEVNDIMMASDNLLELVNGILDISKIEANKLEIINTEYQIEKILKELVTLTKTRIGEKPIEFRCNFDPSIPEVLYGDHTRLKQIILNILTNAAKYTKEGFIEFKISSVLKDNICRLIISIEDSGIGIKPEKIDKLFTKFDRLEVEKTVTIEGTGLGLAITKKLVDLMGGKIVVQSIYGQGSKFTVAIDQRIVAMKAEKKEETKEVIEQLKFPGKKILIVDDTKVNLKVAARLLKSYDVLVDTVDNGFSCIDKIKSQEKYDLILMDDMMPKMSGTETFHKLEQIEGFHIPVVALTANAISGMKESYLKEGFHDYLSKPIEKPELNRILEKFLK